MPHFVSPDSPRYLLVIAAAVHLYFRAAQVSLPLRPAKRTHQLNSETLLISARTVLRPEQIRHCSSHEYAGNFALTQPDRGDHRVADRDGQPAPAVAGRGRGAEQGRDAARAGDVDQMLRPVLSRQESPVLRPGDARGRAPRF